MVVPVPEKTSSSNTLAPSTYQRCVTIPVFVANCAGMFAGNVAVPMATKVAPVPVFTVRF